MADEVERERRKREKKKKVDAAVMVYISLYFFGARFDFSEAKAFHTVVSALVSFPAI